jgi:heme A synthase
MSHAMPIIQLIILLVVVGVILWAVNTYIPMQPTIKKIINIVVIVVVVIYLLGLFGLLPNLNAIRVGN